MLIPVKGGLFSVVDREDFARLAMVKWRADLRNGHPYAVGQVGYDTGVRMADLVLGSGPGFVDHINGKTLDNRRENLRRVSPLENSWNMRKRAGDRLTSTYKGVSGHKKGWRARITYKAELLQLGTYASEREAALAYDRAALHYFGEFACTNVLGDNARAAA